MINAVNESDFKKMFDKGYKVIPVGETDKGYGKCPQIKDREYRDWETNRKSTRLNSSHITRSRMPSSA